MILPAFTLLTLAWSFSWIIMRFQVQSAVPLELSVFYRMAFTSIAVFILCIITKQRLTLTRKEIPFFILIGLLTFCLNFLLGYHAVKYIPSGVIATIFSLSIIISEIISSFVYKRKFALRVVFSGLTGFIGLIFFIFPMVRFRENSSVISVTTGLILALIMVISYSIGNVLIRINLEKNSTPLYTQVAYATAVGSLFVLGLILVQGQKFVFDFSSKYILSMCYLVICASLIAFICLFYLIETIGSARTNYTALIYPVIALLLSSSLENYHFSFHGIFGLILIILALAFQFLEIKDFNKLRYFFKSNNA